MYSDGIRYPVQVSLSKQEYDLIKSAGESRGRSVTAVLTAVIRNATEDFSDFDVADRSNVTSVVVRRGDQSYKNVHVQCNEEQHRNVRLAAAARTRAMSSLMRAVLHASTNGLTDFSVVDILPTVGK